MILFNPTGSLNVAVEPSDLPQETGDNSIVSGAMVRCKNLRTNEVGKAKTRDGSAKINASAINTDIWLIEEQAGNRYTFAGTVLYFNETSIATGLTSASWTSIKYNSFNDESQQVFALNGTDRKRIKGSSAYEWGIAAPNFAPTLSAGLGTGLTGLYNVKYTYVRKVGSVVVSESNPSSAASSATLLSNQSLSVEITDPEDAQVTHARIYRTFANGEIYHFDSEIDIGGYAFGYCYDWESSTYISGTGYKFTTTSTATSGSMATAAVSINSRSILSIQSPTATATYRLASTGVAYKIASGSTTALANEWLLSGTASDYEVMATVNSGSTPSGTLGTWLELSSNQSWSISTSSSSDSCDLLVEIRNAATTTVEASAVISLRAETFL